MAIKVEEVDEVFPEGADAEQPEDADLEAGEVGTRLRQNFGHQGVEVLVENPPGEKNELIFQSALKGMKDH